MGNKESRRREESEEIRRTSVMFLRNYRHVMPPEGENPINAVPTNSVSAQSNLKLDVNIKRSSFQLIPTEAHPDQYSLVFEFDSLTTCLVTVYYFAVEVLDEAQEHTLYFSVDTSLYPSPQSYRFSPGLNYLFPSGASKIQPNLYSEDTLLYRNKQVIPIVITIKPESSDEEEIAWQSSFLSFKLEEGSYDLKLIKQKVHLPSVSYELHEIYGITGKEQTDTADCVICIHAPSCVTVMPCAHLCLCEQCSDLIRNEASRKCPICRTKVDQLIKIEF